MAYTQSWTQGGVPSAFADLTYAYEPESESVWNDTQNRIRQGVAQQVTQRGMPVGRGAYASLVSRGITDAATARAKQEQEAKRLWSQTQGNIRGAAYQPSTIGSVGGDIFKGLMYNTAMQGKNSILGSGIGKLYNTATNGFSSAPELLNGYNALRSGGFEPGSYNWGYSSPSIASGYEAFAPIAAPASPALSSGVGYGIGEEAASGMLAPASESGSWLGDILSKAWSGISSLWG